MPHLIEFYDRTTEKVVPRLQDGSVPRFLYRVMSRTEFDRGTSAHIFRSRDGRLHASVTPLLHHCEPGTGNVLVRISFIPSDGWRAKQTLDGVVAIADQIPASAVTKIAEGSRTQIESELSKMRIEAKMGKKLDLKIVTKGRETGRNFSDGKYVLYQFEIVLNGEEIGELAVKFIDGERDNAKVNIFGNARGRLKTSGMRALFALMKKRFPKLETIYGERISGARAQSGKTNKMAYFTIADYVKSGRDITAPAPTVSQRLSGFFSVMSKPNDDLKRVQQAKRLWTQVIQNLASFLRNKTYRKAFTEREYVQDNNTGISFQTLRSNPFNPPYKRMKNESDVFIVPMSKVLRQEDHPWSDLFLVLHLTQDQASHGTGVFYGSGIWGLPCIVLNWYFARDPAKDDGRFSSAGVKEFRERLDGQATLAKTFVHEFSHFIDHLTSTKKTPILKDERGNVIRWGGDQSKYVQPEVNYRGYINNHREINSRYMEWIDSIIESFDRLYSIKKEGVKGRFKTFHSFWEFYWKESGFAPDNLRNFADPSTVRRLARRLSKFYDYVTQSGTRPAPLNLKRFAARQLDEDPKFVERDTTYDQLASVSSARTAWPFIADFGTEASLHDAFGPKVGEGVRPDEFSRERELEKLWAPKPPKPAKENAVKHVQRVPDDESEDVAPKPKKSGAKSAPSAHAPDPEPEEKKKVRKPRMQLRANYRKQNHA